MSSRGLRNNNPGNIRHDGVRWKGEVVPSKDRSFKQFTSMAYGYRAMLVLLRNYKRLHGLDTLQKMISRYAPPVENHTDNYIRLVSSYTGIAANQPIDTSDRAVMIAIVMAMSRVENGVPADATHAQRGWDLLND